MAGKIKPEPHELEASRRARVATREMDRLEQYSAALRRAQALRPGTGGLADPILQTLIQQAETASKLAAAKVGGLVVSRRRPARPHPTTACTVYLDECGAHDLGAPMDFPVFVLTAVVVPDADYGALDQAWQDWKARELGANDYPVHEPDVRKRKGRWRNQAAIDGLRQTLEQLDFTAIACVVHRPDYIDEHGKGPLDESLPSHIYLMTLDFIFERLALALDTKFGGGRARVVAESRGPREDALLQYEFARLHLDGTSYISDSWFRQQFHPGIDFQGKETNCTGLQLADLVARPCGEKVIDPASRPERWPEARMKLCPGMETKNSILGLKILPWRPDYEELWKS
jgi:hypothetical protein